MKFLFLTIFSLYSYKVMYDRSEKTDITYIPSKETDIFEHIITTKDQSLSEILEELQQQISDTDQSGRPFDAIPIFRGSVLPNKTVEWRDQCFGVNSANVSFDEFNGWTVVLNASSPKSYFCQDWYVIMTSETITYQMIARTGVHKISKKKWSSTAEYMEAKQNGIRIFSFDLSSFEVLKNVLNLQKFLKKINSVSEADLLEFTKETLCYYPITRNQSLVIADSVADKIKTGDVFALHRLDGSSQMNWYFSGSHVSHVAVAIREQSEDGTGSTLFVYETSSLTFPSQPTPPWGNGFRRTEFSAWVSEYNQKDYSIAWLPIKREISDNIDVEFVKKWYFKKAQPATNVSRIFSFVDNLKENLPKPFTEESVILFLLLAEKQYPAVIKTLFLEGINQRLYNSYNAQPVTSISSLLETLHTLQISFSDLVNLPEIDEWKYSDGEALHPAAFVMNILRYGGAFEGMAQKSRRNVTPYGRTLESTPDFNAAEFTEQNVCQLSIFDTQNLPQICKEGFWSTVPLFCQLTGKYLIEIPHFNTVDLVDHIFE
ncbi:hypothetical protein BLNAU_7567 [Blattamonas nauphoetae]|uniref:Uncharacterized protein n=1 Tax=Blattamonas nauphoetae TaxID=2049346 RepID=A0ABQ9Y0Z4_9EUKA|nr:hypothetical protein BLNAU_7567 [Blattamonas nauphoetae]